MMLRDYSFLFFTLLAFFASAEAQIEYNWQNSKEGWVSASEPNLGCVLVAEPNALANEQPRAAAPNVRVIL